MFNSDLFQVKHRLDKKKNYILTFFNGFDDDLLELAKTGLK